MGRPRFPWIKSRIFSCSSFGNPEKDRYASASVRIRANASFLVMTDPRILATSAGFTDPAETEDVCFISISPFVKVNSLCKNGFSGESPDKRKTRKPDHMIDVVYIMQEENASVIFYKKFSHASQNGRIMLA